MVVFKQQMNKHFKNVSMFENPLLEKVSKIFDVYLTDITLPNNIGHYVNEFEVKWERAPDHIQNSINIILYESTILKEIWDDPVLLFIDISKLKRTFTGLEIHYTKKKQYQIKMNQ